MKRKNLVVLPGILVILTLLFAGCATKVKTTMLSPAKAHEAAQLKRIAVLAFSGH